MHTLVCMNRDQLRRCLERELDEWSTIPFEAIKTRLHDDCVYERGEAPDLYQVEVQLHESTPEYVHVGIGVDDGGLSALKPVSASFLVYRDGRVDRPALLDKPAES